MVVNKIELKFSPNNKYIIITYFTPLERTLERNLLPNKMMENLELPMCLLDWIDKDKINWSALSSNPNAEAIALLKKKPDKINWVCLSKNPNAEAIALLKEYPDKIDWTQLSLNPNAIGLLHRCTFKTPT